MNRHPTDRSSRVFPFELAERARRSASLSLLLILFAGCREPSPQALQVVHRLVDPEWRAEASWEPPSLVVQASSFPEQVRATATIPTATIDDDTRYVLASHEGGLLAYQMPLAPHVESRLRATIPLRDALADAGQVVLFPIVRPPGKPSSSLPPSLGRVEIVDGQRQASLDTPLPEALRGRELQLTVSARRPVERGRMLYEVSELQVPPKARLEFAFGLLEPRGGEHRFFIETCRGPDCQRIFDEVVDGKASGPGWQERSVELDGLAARPFSLRFGAERLSDQGAFLPLFANPTVLAPADASQPRRRNVVLISLDTLRRDHLEAYGYARATAPFLGTQLAPRGVVFDDLAAEASTTDPSHMTLFTSLPSLVHGVVSGGMNRLTVPAITLADQLREHGYQTAAFTENGPLAQERGFSIGFEAYRENKSGNLMRPRGLVEDTFGQARTWIASRGDRPFFVFLHTFQVHAPYSPPERYAHYFEEGEGGPAGAGPSTARQSPVDDYDREIRYVDDQLAALHAWFEEQGLDDRTYFIVLSDHGEEFFEHGSLGHATLPYEEVLQVPLIVVGPDIPGPRRSQAPLHHVDLMPTLLDLAGVPAPDRLGGRSFAASARGAASNAPTERPRFSTSWALPAGLTPPALAIRLGDRKLIRYRDASGERLVYFDLATDPGEQQDLPEDGRASELLELAREFEAEAAAQRLQRLRDGETLGEGDPPLMDPEREDMLRSLGYLD